MCLVWDYAAEDSDFAEEQDVILQKSLDSKAENISRKTEIGLWASINFILNILIVAVVIIPLAAFILAGLLMAAVAFVIIAVAAAFTLLPIAYFSMRALEIAEKGR